MKSIETFGQRTSQYRGVTRHHWTIVGLPSSVGLADTNLSYGTIAVERKAILGRVDKCISVDMIRKKRQRKAYDLAVLMKNMMRQEFVANLRRKSNGFSRWAFVYRRVTRHHQHE
ncbi:hypothetical protein AMTR_s00029p00146870 [Amborella trichopoda]|uniref:Uncharacterized protein n=1 Tax=Amborella trichopoda TaxID=13333 RepID=W1PP86_AMBTC|nr:hypothetical protein AMTR_s00029p00146870 [Amborella trichopoda]